jgi:hypothetical protein
MIHTKWTEVIAETPEQMLIIACKQLAGSAWYESVSANIGTETSDYKIIFVMAELYSASWVDEVCS